MHLAAFFLIMHSIHKTGFSDFKKKKLQNSSDFLDVYYKISFKKNLVRPE